MILHAASSNFAWSKDNAELHLLYLQLIINSNRTFSFLEKFEHYLGIVPCSRNSPTGIPPYDRLRPI